MKLYDEASERGVRLALIAATIFYGIFGHIDVVGINADMVRGILPYSVFWTWLSPYYWKDQPYMFILMIQSLIIYGVQWKLVRMGKINRHVFTLSLLVNTIWVARSIPQYTLTTIFMPLATMNPIFTLFEIILKLPLGWSWNLSDAHWACGIYQHCSWETNGLFYLANWGHYLTLFMWIFPTILWLRRRMKK